MHLHQSLLSSIHPSSWFMLELHHTLLLPVFFAWRAKRHAPIGDKKRVTLCSFCMSAHTCCTSHIPPKQHICPAGKKKRKKCVFLLWTVHVWTCTRTTAVRWSQGVLLLSSIQTDVLVRYLSDAHSCHFSINLFHPDSVLDKAVAGRAITLRPSVTSYLVHP